MNNYTSKAIVNNDNSFDSISNKYQIPEQKLIRYCDKYKIKAAAKKNAFVNTKDVRKNIDNAKYSHTIVFTSSEEEELVKHISKFNDVCFGLTEKHAREIVYQYAVYIDTNVPPNWKRNMMAEVDWFYSFMEQYETTLNIGISEAQTSQTKTIEHAAVNFFFDNLSNIMKCFKLQPYDIWSMNETGIFIMEEEKRNRVMARHYVSKIGDLTSEEKNQFVTLVCTASAYGNSIPPYFVYPTIYFQDSFTRDGPVGSTGGTSPTGWMDENNFLSYLAHFVKHVKPSERNHVLLLTNSHISYFSISVLDFARRNGIIMLSIPLNCSHELHPLNVGVLKFLKIFINTAIDSWMLNELNKTISICDIPGIIIKTLPVTLTPLNIKAGFERGGIYPLKRKTLADEDFAPLSITDKPASPQQAVADEENRTKQSDDFNIISDSDDNEASLGIKGNIKEYYSTADNPVLQIDFTSDNDDFKIASDAKQNAQLEIIQDFLQEPQNICDAKIIQEPQPSTSCESKPSSAVEDPSLDDKLLTDVYIKNNKALDKCQTINYKEGKEGTSASLTNNLVKNVLENKRKRKERKEIEEWIREVEKWSKRRGEESEKGKEEEEDEELVVCLRYKLE